MTATVLAVLAVGATLLLVIAIAQPDDLDLDIHDIEEDSEDDGRDEGAEWDRGHDQWVDEQNGVA